MTTIFGSGASPPPPTAPSRLNTSSDNSTKPNDLAEALSPEIQIQRTLKAAVIGVLFQMVFIPFLALFLKYPVELSNGKGYPDPAVVKELDPIHISVAVLKVFGGVFFNFEVLALILIVFAATVSLSTNAKVMKVRPRNKAEWFRKWFSTRLWFGSFFTGLLTAFLSRVYLSLANWEYYNITYVCDEKNIDATCIHEKHLFLPVCSFMLGFYMFWDSIIYDKFVVKFPTIEKKTADVLRLAMLDNFWETIVIAKRYIPLIYIMYFLEGGVFREILSLLGYSLKDPALGHFFQFVDLGLWIQTAIWPTVALFFMKSAWILLQFTITEKLAVQVEVPFSSKDVLRLGDCMNSADILMRYLGFYEFKLLTRTNGKQILEFFTLSHPGGHPRIWNGVCEATLSSCRDLQTTLTGYCSPMSSKTQHVVPDDRNPINLYSFSQNLDSDKNPLINQSPILRQRPQMRDLKYPLAQQQAEAPSLSRIFILSPLILWQGIISVFKGQMKTIYSYLSYLTALFKKVEPELEIANALAKYQLIIWGVNGIVEITCVSIDHDKYGVVQRDMRSVIQHFVDLHDSLVLYSKNPPPGPNTGASIHAKKENAHIVQLLTQGCMYALSKIHGRFSVYYDILGVPKEYQEKILMVSQLHRQPYLRPQRLMVR